MVNDPAYLMMGTRRMAQGVWHKEDGHKEEQPEIPCHRSASKAALLRSGTLCVALQLQFTSTITVSASFCKSIPGARTG